MDTGKFNRRERRERKENQNPNPGVKTADDADDTDGKRFASAAWEMNPARNGWSPCLPWQITKILAFSWFETQGRARRSARAGLGQTHDGAS